MAEIQPLLPTGADEVGAQPSERQKRAERSGRSKAARIASLDVFRGLCVFLMMLVDYVGSIFPIIAHAPWNGVHLADFVMPFFLFVAGVSVAIVYKKVPNRFEATWKVLLKALKLILLGVLLQGGYFHGATSLSYGVDIEKLRLPGILQRIAIGYVVAALCEIWLPRQRWREDDFHKTYIWQWYVVFFLSVIYLWLLYGIYVPDWQFSVVLSDSSTAANNTIVYKVKCAVRGDLGPACNSAGMIDRFVLGLDHLYAKPVYRNLKECNMSSHGQVPLTSPSWCHAPFDPEGILSCCSLHHRTPLWPYFDTITASQGAAVELVSLLGFVNGSRNGACLLRYTFKQIIVHNQLLDGYLCNCRNHLLHTIHSG
ncbi:uncharacterized protein [Henckelia pumila]|uniref:uncharacterized protein isoform X2 n=1 Tax=Henckelia pumila TaxID=405737 RepID=UPI003C6DFDDC